MKYFMQAFFIGNSKFYRVVIVNSMSFILKIKLQICFYKSRYLFTMYALLGIFVIGSCISLIKKGCKMKQIKLFFMQHFALIFTMVAGYAGMQASSQSTFDVSVPLQSDWVKIYLVDMSK